MDRKEYINWCKQRAQVYLDRGDLPNALSSFMSDMGEDPRTTNHPFLMQGAILMVKSGLTKNELETWIKGFN